jgi:N-acetylmuramoyl-L-alanine amidase
MACAVLASLALAGAVLGGTGIRTARKTVVIDPGHGGFSLGAVSPSGLAEKDLVLRFSRTLAGILQEDYAVVLTRTDDISLSLEERTAMANANRADLFISVHARTGAPWDASPTAFFHQSPPTPDREAPPRGWDAAQVPHLAESKAAADLFCRALSPGDPSGDCAAGAPLAVLSGAAMPAVLLEPFSVGGFPGSGEASEALLRGHALALARGIHAFLDEAPPGN